MSKKGNNTIGILFVLLIIFIIIGVFSTSLLKDDTKLDYFNTEDGVTSEKIYKSLLELNEENYPETPEEVVKIYTEGYKLLYSDKIKDMSVVPYILDAQRTMFSNELLEENPIKDQEKNVLESIENLKEQKVKIISSETKPAMYDVRQNNIAYVRVSHQDNYFQIYYYLYHLKRDAKGKWRITGWYNTDENYNIK